MILCTAPSLLIRDTSLFRKPLLCSHTKIVRRLQMHSCFSLTYLLIYSITYLSYNYIFFYSFSFFKTYLLLNYILVSQLHIRLLNSLTQTYSFTNLQTRFSNTFYSNTLVYFITYSILSYILASLLSTLNTLVYLHILITHSFTLLNTLLFNSTLY